LLDRKGTKIFEGDIVSVRGCNHAVRYVPCAFVFTDSDLILNEGLFLNNPVEVIGKIHVNPELLEGKE
jgi:UDP-N-acetylglucosamine 2-epimerase